MGQMTRCASCGAALPEAARFCPTCAAPVEVHPDKSERKLATVIFADLVGSTQLGGSQDPERTRALLDRFYDAMAAEIGTAGGTVEKFAGDAVMAVFGAPTECGVLVPPGGRTSRRMRGATVSATQGSKSDENASLFAVPGRFMRAATR
jgi:class 3 adenylate cyclase